MTEADEERAAAMPAVRSVGGIGVFALVLAVILLVWACASVLVFARVDVEPTAAT